MKINSVFDDAFRAYGRIVTLPEHTQAELLAVLELTTMPESGTAYVAEEPLLQSLPAADYVRDHLFGGMPTQLGWCNGHNTRLNCLEYHRDSEFNLGVSPFILLLALRSEISGGMLDTSAVRAFLVPENVMVELYASTLHYAPCHTIASAGFKVLVALPEGTNGPLPEISHDCAEDFLLRARNKWLLAHRSSDEAANGTAVALCGKNIDIKGDV